MKRHKELLPESLEFSPIRLLGGFICIDTHIGCRGCKFCLNRRQPILHRVLEDGFHLDLSETGLSTAEICGLITSLPSFREAMVPIRIGHLSDWAYQYQDIEHLLDCIPDDYPITLMTRFPLAEPQVETVLRRPNVIVHATLTPYMPEFHQDYTPHRSIVESVSPLPPTSLIFMLRPLVEGNVSETLRIIDSLPEGSHICFKKMSTDEIPSMPDIRPVTKHEIERFVQTAESRNHVALDYFGCVLRKKLGIPFFKFDEIGNQPSSACLACPNRTVCESVTPPGLAEIKTALEKLHIDCSGIRTDGSGVVVETRATASRAEEIYLSEKFKKPIEIVTVKRDSNRGSHYMKSDVFERWASSGFFPVERMETISGMIKKKYESGIYNAD